jgi:ABC-type Na+ efflux pump permease subunit
VGAHKRSTKEALNMIFLILLLYVLLVLPLIFFLAAAIAESIRSTQKGAAFFFRMGEIAVGIIFFAVHYQYWGVNRISSSSLSWTMVCISLLLGGLLLVSKYESRVALRCALLGSASLAFLWYFNGAYHH